MTTTNSTSEFSLDTIVNRLREDGIPAYVEQTGGGCATIYAGATHDEPDWGPRYQAVGGPGWFNGPGWSDPYGSAYEFCVGADDDGATEPDYMPEAEADPVAWTVEKISALVRRDG